jgi:hypothetical protein
VGAAACVITTGGHVHDPVTGQTRGRWNQTAVGFSSGTYSPDGTYFVKQETRQGFESVLTVFALPASEKLHDIRLEGPSEKLVAVLCDSRQRLISVTASDKTSRVRIHGLADGKLIQEFSTLGRVAEHHGATIDASGELLALATATSVRVYDTTAAKAVRQFAAPRGEAPFGGPFSELKGLVFSADGTEVAGVVGGITRWPELIVWDASGSIKEAHELPPSVSFVGYAEPRTVQFSPDGSACLLANKLLFDRRAKTVTWVIADSISAGIGHRAFLDDDRVLALGSGRADTDLVSIAIPHARIRAALEAAASGQDALLKAGDPVRINVNVGDVRFADSNAVAKVLRLLMAKRLAQHGLQVAEDAPVGLQLTYSERPGRQLQVLRDPITATGQTVSETLCTWKATLRHLPSNRVLAHQFGERAASGLTFAAQVSDQSLRDETYENCLRDLDRVSFPDFVPADPDTPVLPIVTRP